MSQSFSLPDPYSLGDLQVYLSRSSRVEDGSVRLVASARVLAVYSAILYPHGLLDPSPTVLGLRTFALSEPAEFDIVVPLRSMLERLVRLESARGEADDPVVVSLPPQETTVTWAGISPPRGGWSSRGQATPGLLEKAARAGIEEVAAAVPTGIGEQLVQRVRSEVWGRPVEGLGLAPAGAAFAAFSLGFLAAEEPVGLFESGQWRRLSTSRGHVLVRGRAVGTPA